MAETVSTLTLPTNHSSQSSSMRFGLGTLKPNISNMPVRLRRLSSSVAGIGRKNPVSPAHDAERLSGRSGSAEAQHPGKWGDVDLPEHRPLPQLRNCQTAKPNQCGASLTGRQASG